MRGRGIVRQERGWKIGRGRDSDEVRNGGYLVDFDDRFRF